jgi:Tfp pilus assembly protein PilN
MSSPNQLSFLPDDYMERKAQRRTNVICASLFTIVLAAIASAFYVSDKALAVVEKQHAEIEKQFADAAKKIEQKKQMQEKQRLVAHQAELTASLLEKVPRSNLLAELTNSLPTGVSLLDMTMDSHLIAPPPPPPAKTVYEEKQNQIAAEKHAAEAAVQPKKFDVSIKLTGVATNDGQVAEFIKKLSKSTLLKDVNLVVVDEFLLEKEPVRKFQLEMSLNPTAEVKALADSKTAAVPVNK